MPATLVRTFLIECYLPGIDQVAIVAAERRVRAAVAAVRREGQEVDYLGATFVPDDEVVFYAFVAPGVTPVEVVGQAAGLAFERIVESFEVGGDPAYLPIQRPASLGHHERRRSAGGGRRPGSARRRVDTPDQEG